MSKSSKLSYKNFKLFLSKVPDGLVESADENGFRDNHATTTKPSREAVRYISERHMESLYNMMLKFPHEQSVQEVFEDSYKTVAEVLNDCFTEHRKNYPKAKNLWAIPLTIRKILYLLVYFRYAFEFGFDRNKKDVKKAGFSKEIIDGVNREWRLINTVADTKVGIPSSAFSNWGIAPYSDFKQWTSYTSPIINVDYAGKKHHEYGFMINYLIDWLWEDENTRFDVFADVFGGSGQAFMNAEPKAGVREYINDFDLMNYTFYKVVSSRCTEFVSLCEEVKGHIEKTDTKNFYRVIREEGYRQLKEREKRRLDSGKSLISDADSDFNAKGEKLEKIRTASLAYAVGLWVRANNISKKIVELNGEPEANVYKEIRRLIIIEPEKYCLYISDKINAELAVAFAFYFLQYFMFSGKSKTITAVNKAKIRKFIKEGFEGSLEPFGNRIKAIRRVKGHRGILNESAMDLLTDPPIQFREIVSLHGQPLCGYDWLQRSVRYVQYA
jgi:hypothetical protein